MNNEEKVGYWNDRLREGNTFASNGQINVSASIEVDYHILISAMALLVFDEGDDERDSGYFVIDGIDYSFQIDYYDLSWADGSLGDPTVTKRVLTIMLAGDY